MCLFARLFHVCFYALTQVWRSEESFQALIFSSSHIIWLSSKHLYPLSHLASPQLSVCSGNVWIHVWWDYRKHASISSTYFSHAQSSQEACPLPEVGSDSPDGLEGSLLGKLKLLFAACFGGPPPQHMHTHTLSFFKGHHSYVNFPLKSNLKLVIAELKPETEPLKINKIYFW